VWGNVCNEDRRWVHARPRMKEDKSMMGSASKEGMIALVMVNDEKKVI
jgi:hypothetical protein